MTQGTWEFDRGLGGRKYSGKVGDHTLHHEYGGFVNVDRWVDKTPILQTWGAGKIVCLEGDAMSAFDTQVGGTHYTKMAIQPFQYSMANGLDPMQHTIVKYVSRFRDKNGIEDLKKARQTIDLLIEWEEQNAQKAESK